MISDTPLASGSGASDELSRGLIVFPHPKVSNSNGRIRISKNHGFILLHIFIISSCEIYIFIIILSVKSLVEKFQRAECTGRVLQPWELLFTLKVFTFFSIIINLYRVTGEVKEISDEVIYL